MLRKKDEDKDDEGNGNTAANPYQTSGLPNEGSSKFNTLEKTTYQQGKGGEDSPYKRYLNKTNIGKYVDDVINIYVNN